jgi:hypothetical protein
MKEEKELTPEEIEEMLKGYEADGYDVFKVKKKKKLSGLDNDIKKELNKENA